MTRPKLTPKAHLREVDRSPEEHARRVQALIDDVAAARRGPFEGAHEHGLRRPFTENEKPEVLRLWEQISDLWAELEADVERWTRADHPLVHELARVQALHGSHGLSDRRLVELDKEGVAHRHRAMQRFSRLRQRVRLMAREDANDRGPTLAQLCALIDADATEQVDAARIAITEWWDDKECADKRRAACWHAYVLLNGASSIPAFLDSSTFGVDIAELEDAFAKARRLDPNLKGGASRAASWIVRELQRRR